MISTARPFLCASLTSLGGIALEVAIVAQEAMTGMNGLMAAGCRGQPKTQTTIVLAKFETCKKPEDLCSEPVILTKSYNI